MSDKKSIPYRWFEEVWNNGKEEVIDELFAKDGFAHGLEDADGNKVIGPDGFKPFYRNFRTAFPDVKMTLVQVIEEGDLVAMIFTITGTQTGPGFGLDATNRPISITGMSFIRVKNGQIAEAWNNVDFLTMFNQLGAVGFPIKFK